MATKRCTKLTLATINVLCFAALSIGCASVDDPAKSDVELTWDRAERFVPTGKNPPVIVFLHGCTGITEPNRVWGRLLRDAGYLVVMPNSFARRGRYSFCDPRTHTGTQTVATWQMRQEEAAYAVKRILNEVSPPKIVVFGHSEGGIAVQMWRAPDEVNGAIVSGSRCVFVYLPATLPTLILRYQTDPWDPGPPKCQEWARKRGEPTTLLLLPGDGHDPAGDRRVERRVLQFLDGIPTKQ